MQSKRREKEDEVLAAIERLIDSNGYPPTRSEIAREMGWASANSAQVWLERLEHRSLINLTAGVSRGISIVSRGNI